MSEDHIHVHEEIKFTDADDFTTKAKELVSETFNFQFVDGENEHTERTKPQHFYVVWFAKTLGNWKALVSTDIVDGLYWEITHNGAKQETYVDTYKKLQNHVVRDFDAPVS